MQLHVIQIYTPNVPKCILLIQVDTRDAKWDVNSAGFYHSHKHGFGLLNAWRLVNAAKVWHSVPWLTSLETSTMKLNMPIPGEQRTAVATYKGIIGLNA